MSWGVSQCAGLSLSRKRACLTPGGRVGLSGVSLTAAPPALPARTCHPRGLSLSVTARLLEPSHRQQCPDYGHLMQRVDSLEKNLMLGGIGGRRRRG